MNDDAVSDDGNHGGDRDRGLGRTGLLQNPAFMGEHSADIVIGALQKVQFPRRSDSRCSGHSETPQVNSTKLLRPRGRS